MRDREKNFGMDCQRDQNRRSCYTYFIRFIFKKASKTFCSTQTPWTYSFNLNIFCTFHRNDVDVKTWLVVLPIRTTWLIDKVKTNFPLKYVFNRAFYQNNRDIYGRYVLYNKLLLNITLINDIWSTTNQKRQTISNLQKVR